MIPYKAVIQAPRIIVAEEGYEVVRKVRSYFVGRGFDVVSASNTAETTDLLAKGNVGVLSIVLNSIRVDRWKIMDFIKNGDLKSLPILFIADKYEQGKECSEILPFNPTDTLLIPFLDLELILRIARLNRVGRLLVAFETLSFMDPLTDCYNRQALVDRLAGEYDRAKRHGLQLGFIIADVDRFKEVNARFGLAAGDEVLRYVSGVIRNSSRINDIVGRFLSNTFGLVLPETPQDGALLLAERLRRRIEASRFEYKGLRVPITISCGAAFYNTGSDSQEELLRRAEDALDISKDRGGNLVSKLVKGKLPFESQAQSG